MFRAVYHECVNFRALTSFIIRNFHFSFSCSAMKLLYLLLSGVIVSQALRKKIVMCLKYENLCFGGT